ncbi:MAG: helix-hairpin-helix domain-containing protein [Pseudomonadota bacterium]
MAKRVLFILCVVLIVFSLPGISPMASGSKININTATVEELCGLKGVGQAYAKAIVEYRTEHGQFKVPEEIKNVKGIGEKIFQENKETIQVKDDAKQ